MDLFGLLTMIGGLALFLYGMNAMGDGLAKMAGGKLEQILEKLTSKRIYALLLGAAVTAVIQSSSATTVMVVGFVNSGIMQLSQAVGIIMGANVGTTITSWLLSLTGIEGSTFWLKLLKPSSFAPVLAAVGILLTMSAKEDNRRKDVGNIMLGFAILMFGMETMSGAVAPLADDPKFTGILTAFSNPVLGILAGTILTAAIQSSSASVGILQALCATGAVSYSAALPIIMGQNIGTCVTALISSVGANKNAKRASMIHLYFNLVGTVIFMVVFYGIHHVLNFAFMGSAANPAGIAVIHSLFNVGCCVVLFPFANGLVKLAQITIPEGPEVVVPEKTKTEASDISIDERFMKRPAFAMEICRNMTKKMAEETREALLLSLGLLDKYSKKKAKRVIALEQRVDRYEDVLGSYLVRLSSRNLSKKDSQSMSVLLHSISDWERISDHAANLMESAQEMDEKGLSFSKTAKREISVLRSAVSQIVENTTEVFCKEDLEGATHVEPLEQVIDKLAKEIKKNHVKRLQDGKCTIELGLVLEDVLTNLERVSDHCSNIAVEMIAIEKDGYDTHEYFEVMPQEEKDAFQKEYKKLKKKYRLDQEDDKIKKSKKDDKDKKAKK
ncbi:MAG: Na/Pi cotransporter family protein [Lachnospiraceae bacterium]|nr:Na/Pi cotransporter family protein [Lachnospiraceae bacterium]